MKKCFLVFALFFGFPPLGAQVVQETFVNPSRQSEPAKENLPPADAATNETYVNTNAIIDSLWTNSTVELTPDLVIQEHLRKQQQSRTPLPKAPEPAPIPSKNASFQDNFQTINTIVLDAGHGGKDPGAIERRGINGLKEKHLVMAILKRVHSRFRKNRSDIKVYVTRKNDTFLSLEERVSKAARWSAPATNNVLFISVHGNSSLSSRPEGLEIYTLSDRASDPEALEVERLENAGFTTEDIKKTQGLYSLLADLIRDGTRRQSEQLARFVYNDTLSEIQSSGGVGRGVRKANFFVLKYNTVPSILIEVGYISHPGEVRRLKNSDYQEKLAEGIYKGISKFVDEYNETKGFTTVKG